MRVLCLCVILFGSVWTEAPPITDTLTKADLARFKALSEKALSQPTLSDLSTLFYASNVASVLSATSKNAKSVCDFVKTKVSSSASQLQNVYYIAGINKALSCGIAAREFEKTLKLVEDDKTKMQDRFYGVQAALDFGSTLTSDTILKSVVSQLAPNLDAPLASQVYGLHISSNLAGKTSPDLTTVFSMVEDIVGQADEVNEKYLQLEGGLGVTALFVEGAFSLATKLKKPPVISPVKLQQLASYVLSRKDSQSLKSVYFVLLASKTLSSNPFLTPVCVTLESPPSLPVGGQSAKVQLKVSNLMGEEVKGVGAVSADQVATVTDGAVILSKEVLKATPTDKSLYSLDLSKVKTPAGFYTITVSVSSAPTATASAPKLVGIVPGNAKLNLKLTSEVKVVDMKVAVIDAESSSTVGQQNSVTYPDTLKSTLFADSSQKVVATFSIRDKLSNVEFEPHQVFMRLVHIESQQEAFFVCEKSPVGGKGYEFEMKVKTSDSIFKSFSGDYEMHLIVGDAVVTNSFMWLVSKLTLAFADGRTYSSPSYADAFQPKPEIHHLFRTPEPRPPLWFSQLAAAVCVVPLLVLLLVWSRMGANVSNMQMDVPTVGFHLGLVGIFSLYYCYWAYLNMFQTLKYLFVLGAVTFFCGHKLLKNLAIARINNSRVVGG